MQSEVLMLNIDRKRQKIINFKLNVNCLIFETQDVSILFCDAACVRGIFKNHI